MELFFLIFKVFHDFKSSWEPCLLHTLTYMYMLVREFIVNADLSCEKTCSESSKLNPLFTNASDETIFLFFIFVLFEQRGSVHLTSTLIGYKLSLVTDLLE